jgi:Fe-S cluster assembly scaffold protein SufB
MRQQQIQLMFFCALLAAILSASFAAHSQTAPTAHGVVRLKVRYKSSNATKDLQRKRFFLIKGGWDQNRELIERAKQTTLPSRECYYRGRSASAALIKWLTDNDCESVYCRLIEEKRLAGVDAVPEFQVAYEQARRELKNDELARRWLTNYLSPEIRSGFYDEKQKAIQALMAFAETSSKAGVMSVMTDRKGTAYFTNIDPGVYTISNLVASETEKTSILWICEREIKAVDLGTAMKRPFTLSNEKDPKVKCEVVEKPLPVCPMQ